MTTPATAEGFPLDSFKDAATHLRRPFTAQAVKFKIQATWPKDNPEGGLVVCYIDARLAGERLNLIVPHLWWDHYEREDKGYRCLLTVDGITREDIGDGFGKGGYSDALKRAAVKFGVGVSLYAVPKMIVNVSGGHAKVKRSNQGTTLELTPNGETKVRDLYSAWLDVHGSEAFGTPLDHGDSERAQGDFEADDTPVTEAVAAEPEVFVLAKDIVDELVASKQATGKDEAWVRQQLAAVGVEVIGKVSLATIKGLTEKQALGLLERFEVAIEAPAVEAVPVA